MILGLVGAAGASDSVDCHLRLGMRYERRTADVEGRRSCRQHRAAAWEGIDMIVESGRESELDRQTGKVGQDRGRAGRE